MRGWGMGWFVGKRTAPVAVVALAVATIVVAGAPAIASASATPKNATIARASPTATGRVLRVGTWHGIKGAFTSVQEAVDAARPGDWILVAPGDYHEQAGHPSAAARSRIRISDRSTPEASRPGATAWRSSRQAA